MREGRNESGVQRFVKVHGDTESGDRENRTMSPSFVRTYLRVGDIDNVIVVNSHHAL